MAEVQPQLAELLADIRQLENNGANRFDPARFCFLQQQGERLLRARVCSPRSLQRLADALSDYQQRLNAARKTARQAMGDTPEPAVNALFESQDFPTLLRRLRRPGSVTPLHQLQQHYNQPATPDTAPQDPLQRQLQSQENGLMEMGSADSAPPQAPRQLQALNRVRASRKEQHRRQRIDKALTQVPSDAGPLNSHRLVTRAISTLQELSPAYLDHFVNHVDALMALEKLGKKRPA